jgi:hypothetical protein
MAQKIDFSQGILSVEKPALSPAYYTMKIVI